MKTTAYVLSIICVIVAIMYFVLPGGSLPTFLPGYVAGSTHIHKMNGFAAATGAIVFLLIALSTRRARDLSSHFCEIFCSTGSQVSCSFCTKARTCSGVMARE